MVFCVISLEKDIHNLADFENVLEKFLGSGATSRITFILTKLNTFLKMEELLFGAPTATLKRVNEIITKYTTMIKSSFPQCQILIYDTEIVEAGDYYYSETECCICDVRSNSRDEDMVDIARPSPRLNEIIALCDALIDEDRLQDITHQISFVMLITSQFIEQYYLNLDEYKDLREQFAQQISELINSAFSGFAKELINYKDNSTTTSSFHNDLPNLLHDIDHTDKEWRFSLGHYSSYLMIHCQTAIICTFKNKIRELADHKLNQINERLAEMIKNFSDNKTIEGLDRFPDSKENFLTSYMKSARGISDLISYTDLPPSVIEIICNIVNTSFQSVFEHFHGLSHLFWNRKGLVQDLIQSLSNQMKQNIQVTVKITETVQVLFDNLRDCTPEAVKLLFHKPIQIDDVPACKVYKHLETVIENFATLSAL